MQTETVIFLHLSQNKESKHLENGTLLLIKKKKKRKREIIHLDTLNGKAYIDMSVLQQTDSKFTSALLFDDTSFDNNKNTFILDGTIDYIISTGGFDVPLFSSS